MGNEARELFERAGARTMHDASYAAECVRKWARLLQEDKSRSTPDPINQPYVKKMTAMLLENEMEHLKSFHEDTLSTNTGSFTKYIFPILRRVFPNLIATQLVSVQPMNAPVGGVFYYEKKYDDRKGTKIPPTAISNNPTDQNYDGELSADDNMAQNLAMYYSNEFVDYDVVCTNTAAASGALTQASANCRLPNWSPIRAPGTAGQRTFYVQLYYSALDTSGTGLDADVVATLDSTGSTTNLVDGWGNTVGTFDVTTGNWSLNAADSAGANTTFTASTVIYAQYFVNWELVGYTDGAEIPSVSLDISLQTVQAESRKLKARWTVEAVDDLRALQGLDAETELVSTFSNEVMLELDREIIQDLINGAQHSATYAYSSTVPGEIESIRQLITQISAVSARIHKTSGRAPANFLVVSPEVAALLDQLSTHGDYASIESGVKAPSYGPVTADFGISRIGTLLRKWAVYENPHMAAGTILIGLKGNSFLDAGYVYAPYIPLQVTPTFMDPDDFTFRKGIRTRYATKMLRPEYYGTITVTGLPTVTSS